MSNKMMKLVALALVVMLALSGCNLIRTDPAYIAQQEAEEAARIQAEYEKDMATELAVFDGGSVTKGEVYDSFNENMNMYAAYLQYMNYMYSMFMGTTYADTIPKEDAESLRDTLVISKVQEKVLLNKMEEMGLGTLTEEDLAEIQEKSDTEYQTYLDTYLQEGYTEDDAKYYLSFEGISENTVYQLNYRDAIDTRMSAAVNEGVTVSDEEIQAKYEALVSEAKENFENDNTSVEEAVLTQKPVYFMPEGHRYVKHVLLKVDDEIMSTLEDAKSAGETLESELAALEEKLSAEDEDQESVQAQIEEKKAAIEENEIAVTEANEAVWASVQERLDKVQADIASGRSFDEIIADYSDDYENVPENIVKDGYLVYTSSDRWDESFLNGVNGLQNVGDISEPVMGVNGIHVILYAADPVTGDTPFESVSETVALEALKEKKLNNYNEQIEKWVEEANVIYTLSNWKVG